MRLGKVCANDDFNALAIVINLAFQPQIHGEFVDERAKSAALLRSDNLKFSRFHARAFINCVPQ